MANADQKYANLKLSPEEQRLYNQVFSAADSDSIGVVTGDVALRFLPEKTRLQSEVLGEIWQIADTDDKGFLTPAGFYVVLRLIGYAQAGRTVSADLAAKSGGPLPRFEGINTGPAASPLQAQGSGGPIRVPPLTAEHATKYAQLFQQSGAQNGSLSGTTAKQIFDRAALPNDILVRIWNLADTEQRGLLSETEFTIAMHLLASYRNGSLRALPHNLPAGLYEAAARRGVAPPRPLSVARQSPAQSNVIPRQFSGSSQRPSSPLSRQPYTASNFQPIMTENDWAVTPQEKEHYDAQFDKLDTGNQGFVSGEQAVGFFGNSSLSEDDLAQIWDLSDINSAGQLGRDEFAVAMYLIRQQLAKRGPLPTTLPVNLIPPSMRSSVSQTSQAPTQSPPPKAKSAADDLFGLDAISSPPVPPPTTAQVPQSTGGSSAAPAPLPSSPKMTSQPSAPTTFKPFVPSSSFGQSIVSPQATGVSHASSSRATLNDDLLGDTDPEVNEKLTNETTELANLSNQVTNLSNQMQEVKNKRSIAEQNTSQVNTQKRGFETRLTQLRSAYEREARELRTLNEKLAASTNDTKKVQADLAMVEHSYSSLREQHQQVLAALEADQRENASLKERMRQVNLEISQLKPQLEKAKSDARQQKGLVAINKKQLSTSEADRERTRTELEIANTDYQESTKELEESSKSLELQKSISPKPIVNPAGSPAPSVASQSTNPFFRRTATGGSQQEHVRSPFTSESVSSPNHSAFDSFFAAAMPTSSPFTPPAQGPPSSLETSQTERAPAQASPTSEGHAIDVFTTGTGTNTPITDELPSVTQLPPPPPQSRQITSSSLPLREATTGPPSENSSIGVAPPASRFGDDSGYSTPALDRQGSQFASGVVTSPLAQTHTTASSQESSSGQATPQENTQIIPGSFPGEENTSTPAPEESKDHKNDDPFASDIAHERQPKVSSTKDDFDSAFADLRTSNKSVDDTDSFPQLKQSSNDEFPPIRQFDNDDDSSSESDKGFEDNFAPSAVTDPVQDKEKSSAGQTGVDEFAVANPQASDLLRSTSASTLTTELPTPNAQVSPPTYEQTVPQSGSDNMRKDSNQFPPEFTGLLPARTDPTFSEVKEAEEANAESAVGPSSEVPSSTAATINPSIANFPAAQASSITTASGKAGSSSKEDIFDDFENEFGDLSEAKPADEKIDDDFGGQRDNTYFDEFNPSFDSPVPSKTTTNSAFRDNNAFNEFEYSATSTSQIPQPGATAAAPIATSHDWDAMFAGLEDSSFQADGDAGNQNINSIGNDNNLLSTPSKPALGRALSSGTEHDDPILKRLTAMGYPRDQSLAALEKFDYNLDKAADYLTSKV